jgi:hypothetical protein
VLHTQFPLKEYTDRMDEEVRMAAKKALEEGAIPQYVVELCMQDGQLPADWSAVTTVTRRERRAREYSYVSTVKR